MTKPVGNLLAKVVDNCYVAIAAHDTEKYPSLVESLARLTNRFGKRHFPVTRSFLADRTALTTSLAMQKLITAFLDELGETAVLNV